MSDPIIVGTDGTPHSDRAVRWAADEAVHRGRVLHIVYARENWPYDISFYPASDTTDLLAHVGRDILAEAEKLALDGRLGLRVTTELAAPSTVRALEGRSAHAFEIVVGHRGLGGFAGLMLGSVGLRMAEHSAAPVVIVRGEAEEEHGEIAVGVDLIDDTAALGYAFQAAADRGARLRVVHAWQIPERLLDATGPIDIASLEERVRWAVLEAHAPWSERFPGLEVSEEIVRDHPVAALTDVSNGVDLVVVGSHGRGAIPCVRLGSTSHGVIHHAHCPVAVARAAANDDKAR